MSDDFQFERNIIFLFPIGRNLKELKADLEKLDNYNVFEVDGVSEFAQLANSLQKAVAFCSDTTKTIKTLETYEKLIRRREIKFILATEQNVPPLTFIGLQKKGLHESIPGSLNKRAITYKLDFIYRTFEAKAKALELKKQKEEQDQLKLLKLKEQKTENAKIDTMEKQRVEKGMLDENSNNLGGMLRHQNNFKENQKGNLNDFSGFGSQENQNLQSSDTLNSEDNANTIQSHYSNVRDRTENLFQNEEDDKKTAKKYENVFDQNDLKRKNIDYEEADFGYGKKKAHLDQYESDLNRRDGMNFDELELEKKKRKSLDSFESELNVNNDRTDFGTFDQNETKRKTLEEVAPSDLYHRNKNANLENPLTDVEKEEADYQNELENYRRKKGLHLNDQEIDLKKAANDLEWDASINDKNKHHSQSVDFDLENKKGLTFDQEDLQRKRNAQNLNSFDLDEKKKQDLGSLDEDLYERKGNLSEDTLEDYNKKKSMQFEDLDDYRKKKSHEFNSEDFERNKHTNMGEFDAEYEKKKGIEFDPGELEKKRHAFSENYEDHHRKSNFQEEKISTYWGRSKEEEIAKDKKKHAEVDIDMSLKEKTNVFGVRIEEEQLEETPFEFVQQEIDEELEYSTYFPPDTQFAIYLAYLTPFYMEKNFQKQKICQFIQFILTKMKSGIVSYYQVSETATSYTVDEIFSGHRQGTIAQDLLGASWDSVVGEWGAEWAKIKSPWWSDPTWQQEIQTFIYPFYDGPKQLGFAVAHFKGTIQSEQEAKEVEMMIISARGTYYAI